MLRRKRELKRNQRRQQILGRMPRKHNQRKRMPHSQSKVDSRGC
jgi:hypothetical protein